MSPELHAIRDYKNPPVIETVLSVQFLPLEEFSIGHFGLYWERIRTEFSKIQVHPPLGQMKEDFGRRNNLPGLTLGFELVPEPTVRCWFLDAKGNQIIQVQRDRFIYNWQKVTGEETYPRYESVRSKFEQAWNRFLVFLQEEKLGSPEVNQCEVTYVNHIEYEKGWKSFGELSKVIAVWSGAHSGTFLPEPENVNVNVRYPISDGQGRLYVSMHPVIRARDAKEVLQLNLTARGAPTSSSTEAVLQWLDLGRKWVVEGFTDFTTKEMHKVWGRMR